MENNHRISIKITESGTLEEVIKALTVVVDELENEAELEFPTYCLDGAVWEDNTLLTEINLL